MNRVACLLNTPELGGAERSFITQLNLFENKDQFDLFYPVVEGKKISCELEDFILSNGLRPAQGLEYDSALYSTSRSGSFGNFLNILIGLLCQILNIKSQGLLRYEKIWTNGNKVFVPVFLSSLFFGYRGKVIWHLRDYPSGHKLNEILNLLYIRLAKFTLILFGNSDSTLKEYARFYPRVKGHRLYNPVQIHSDFKKESVFNGVLGFAGMSAPWKGLHELYLWSSLYEKELLELGVKEIALYGKNIYLTQGDHSKYQEELIALRKKFPSKLIVEKGLVKPEKIFSDIDIMLHLSNRPEPFGRVILESFGYGVPCISTGLGGAGELMTSFKELVHFPYDYGGLTKKVELLVGELKGNCQIVQKGHEAYESIQNLAESDLNSVKSLYFQ